MSTKKRAVRIEPTCVRKSRAKKEKRASGPDQGPPLPQAKCVFVSGKTSCVGLGVYEITRALRDVDPNVSVNDLFIKSETGIDVKDDRNGALLDNLFNSSAIDAREEGDRVMFRRKPNLSIQDCRTLKAAINSSWARDKMTLSTKDLSNTYRGVEKDVERLVEDGDVGSLNLDGCPIFFKRLQGTSASSSIKDLWHSIEVPKGDRLQEKLVESRLLTKEELDVRAARDKLERDKAKADADQAAADKKARKMPIIRKVTNAHLQLPFFDGS